MALHGDVKVNGLQIGQWVAVRRELEPHAAPITNTYDVQIILADRHTHGPAHHRLEVKHLHADGDMALLARIFAMMSGLSFDEHGAL